MSSKVIRLGVFAMGVVALPVLAAAQGSAPLRKVEAAFDAKQAQEPRIVGGRPVTLRANRWQVAIVAARIPLNTEAQFCGGSIAAPRWVVTAAHCVDSGTLPAQIAILTGTASLDKGGHRVPATRIVVHENWNPKTHDFDIALVEVGSDLGGRVVPGDASTADPARLSVRVTGWGRTAWHSQAGARRLQGVTVPYVARATCNEPASYDGGITPNMFCAGLREGGADSCQGDSGGPATAVVGNVRRLIGVVSWGEGCALRNKYGVYTRVARFGQWATEKTAGAVKW